MELEEYKDNYNKGYIEEPITEESEPTLEEAIKVLQKHFTENKELFQECFEMQLKLPFEVKKAKLDGEIAFKAAKNFLDNLIKE